MEVIKGFGRLMVFVLVVAVAALARVVAASIAHGEEYVMYTKSPVRMLDWSLDFVMAAVALLIGLRFYVPKDGKLTKPGTNTEINPGDIAEAGWVVFGGLI